MSAKARLHHRRLVGPWVLAIPVMLLLGLFLIVYGESVIAAPVTTPLEDWGMTPIWQEDFTNGSIDRLQYAWGSGDPAASTSYVMPGAVFLGNDAVITPTDVPVQQINNFKAAGEARPDTIEFDVFSPYVGFGRVALRPRRTGDLVGILLRLDGGGKTQVNYDEGGVTKSFTYTVTSVAGKWDHVVVSYRQEPVGDPISTTARYVISIGEEVREFTRTTEITNPAWISYYSNTTNADGWSFQHSTLANTQMGKYIANIRAYEGFLSLTDLQTRLSGRVATYVNSLTAPTGSEPKKSFQRGSKTMVAQQSYALGYANQPPGNLTVDFDGSLSSAYQKITSYQWTFGEGGTGSGRFFSYTYPCTGVFNVGLTVTSQNGTDAYTFPFTVTGNPSQTCRKSFLPLIMRQ